MRFPLQGIVRIRNSHIPFDDRFAAQIVYAAGRCPPIYRLMTCSRSFHSQFHDSQIICPCLDSLLVGEMGVVRDDLAVVDKRG